MKSLPSSFFTQNMAVLRRIFPGLAEELDKTEDEAEFQIEGAASGAPTLFILKESPASAPIARAIYAHSKRDPEREAERLAEDVLSSDNSVNPALVLGFGLGYTASALAAKDSGRPIIVVEKRASLIKKALEVRDLRPLLLREKLAFVLDVEAVTDALSLFESSPGTPPLVLQNRALTGLDSDWYAAAEEKIKTWNTRTNVNQATRRRFGKRWVRNLSKNLSASGELPGITALEGLLRENELPVFLAAAGPSLDHSLPILHEIHKRCVIVAVDTSFRFLLEQGIKADFVVSVDPQYWNFRHLDRAFAAKTRLITELAVYPSLLRHHFDGIFLCSSFFPLGRYIEKQVDQKGELGAGGSVATSAWDFARHIGAKSIWIAGLDLSFPALKTHFKGALFEEKALSQSFRLAPCENWNFRALRDGQHFMAKARSGGMVLTDKRLSLYAAWFESRFRQFPEIKNYSLPEEGLDIKGLITAAKEDLLVLPNRRSIIDELLAKTYSAIEAGFGSQEAAAARSKKYKNAQNVLLNGLEAIKRTAQEAAEQAEIALAKNKLGHLNGGELKRALEKLDRANHAITKSEVKEIAGFLFPDSDEWEAEIAAESRNQLGRHLEFSFRFYKALAEAADYNLRVLTR